jgi:hypothetical protein
MSGLSGFGDCSTVKKVVAAFLAELGDQCHSVWANVYP